MINVFQNVPGWLSVENQSAGIAVADLTGTGQQDLLVLRVDTPGANQASYQIGRKVDNGGNITGGWSGWVTVPDWSNLINQGAGIATADLNNDGLPELITMRIDHLGGGANQASYRVGKGLNANGNVANWGNWIAIPDWFSWENQGGSIAVADIDQNGHPDLLVFMIDNPPGPNRAYYRIGWNLDTNGNVTNDWSDWIEIPDWFSWENQGAGITVADLTNTGQLDLIIFQIDNPPQLNQAYFKFGKNLSVFGQVQNGWTPWRSVPGWFSWENQGGGIAPLAVNGNKNIVALLVDNPPGPNAAEFKVLDLTTDPQRLGKWDVLSFDSEILAIHAALLPGGRVLFYAGSGNSTVRVNSPDFGNTLKKVWTSVVWNPSMAPQPGTDDNFFHPNTLKDSAGKPLDFFCGGESFLPDGRLLAAGGTNKYPVPNGARFLGLAATAVFDPQTLQWSQVQSMTHGRWYPTLVTLGDGRILAVSGLDENGDLNTHLEVYDTTQNSWQQLNAPGPAVFAGFPLYAHLFLLNNGNLFFSGGRMDDPSPVGPCLLDITQNPAQVTPVLGLRDPDSRNQSTSILLPPAQDQRIMILGGAPDNQPDATFNVDIINLSVPNPTYQPGPAMNFPRIHPNAVLLPDRTVFVSGGAPQREFKTAAALQSEIYDPVANTWNLAAMASIPRLYHSIALLLPDGRVIAAGGNPDRGRHVQWEPPDPNEELQLEVYSPLYLFRGPRPVINIAPTEIHYNQAFAIQSAQAGNVRWVHLIRNGVTTHSFNTGQRLVDLPINNQVAGIIAVGVTNNHNLAPPGWYMLFIVDQDSIPSEGWWVHLT